MIKYCHTQIGYLLLGISIALIPILLLVFRQDFNNLEPLGLVILLVLVLISMAVLNVTIDDKVLRISFGYGIFQKKFALSEIVSARCVKNHWYYGWGIRYWVWPRMWIYNVSGLNAVEIKMRNGRIFRIGTDEPQKLADTITDNIIEM